jgi:hypothetical protein
MTSAGCVTILIDRRDLICVIPVDFLRAFTIRESLCLVAGRVS